MNRNAAKGNAVDISVISLGGIERGVATALVVKPSYSDALFHPKKGFEKGDHL